MARVGKTSKINSSVWYSIAAARILLGFIFLWAFLDKTFGLGFATKAAKAWVNGGSPTTGFLKSVEGPFAEFFNGLAGQAWADWLFMIGLLGIGVGLILGVAIRLSVVAGSVMLLLMWLASLPLQNNPVIDDHLVYIVMLAIIGISLPQQKWSLAEWWRKMPVVRSQRWLQ